MNVEHWGPNARHARERLEYVTATSDESFYVRTCLDYLAAEVAAIRIWIEGAREGARGAREILTDPNVEVDWKRTIRAFENEGPLPATPPSAGERSEPLRDRMAGDDGRLSVPRQSQCTLADAGTVSGTGKPGLNDSERRTLPAVDGGTPEIRPLHTIFLSSEERYTGEGYPGGVDAPAAPSGEMEVVGYTGGGGVPVYPGMVRSLYGERTTSDTDLVPLIRLSDAQERVAAAKSETWQALRDVNTKLREELEAARRARDNTLRDHEDLIRKRTPTPGVVSEEAFQRAYSDWGCDPSSHNGRYLRSALTAAAPFMGQQRVISDE